MVGYREAFFFTINVVLRRLDNLLLLFCGNGFPGKKLLRTESSQRGRVGDLVAVYQNSSKWGVIVVVFRDSLYSHNWVVIQIGRTEILPRNFLAPPDLRLISA